MSRRVSGWSTSDRRERLPRDWKRIRERVMIRDAGLCQWPITGAGRCGHPARDVDHRDNPADHSEFNLWCLCGKHHDEKTRREAYAGRTFQRRSAEAHPGLIDRPEPENRPW